MLKDRKAKKTLKAIRMTNKEAVDILKLAIAEIEWIYPMDFQVALEKAIEVLSKQERSEEE